MNDVDSVPPPHGDAGKMRLSPENSIVRQQSRGCVVEYCIGHGVPETRAASLRSYSTHNGDDDVGTLASRSRGCRV